MTPRELMLWNFKFSVRLIFLYKTDAAGMCNLPPVMTSEADILTFFVFCSAF